MKLKLVCVHMLLLSSLNAFTQSAMIPDMSRECVNYMLHSENKHWKSDLLVVLWRELTNQSVCVYVCVCAFFRRAAIVFEDREREKDGWRSVCGWLFQGVRMTDRWGYSPRRRTPTMNSSCGENLHSSRSVACNPSASTSPTSSSSSPPQFHCSGFFF